MEEHNPGKTLGLQKAWSNKSGEQTILGVSIFREGGSYIIAAEQFFEDPLNLNISDSFIRPNGSMKSSESPLSSSLIQFAHGSRLFYLLQIRRWFSFQGCSQGEHRMSGYFFIFVILIIMSTLSSNWSLKDALCIVISELNEAQCHTRTSESFSIGLRIYLLHLRLIRSAAKLITAKPY